MANKFDGDVRPLSNDPRYMGVVFEGLIDDAIQQAKDAPDHGLADQIVPRGMNRDRAALLEHLNLLEDALDISIARRTAREEREAEEPGFYTLAYARKHFPQCFKSQASDGVMHKQYVMSVHETAVVKRSKPYGWDVVWGPGVLLGHGNSAKDAWLDAAANLRASTEQRQGDGK